MMAKPAPLPDIFRYLDYRAYLRDWFDAKKATNPRFSHRLFARKAGQRSPSLLLHIIERQRNLTPATTEAFARALGLGAEEAEFFSSLVHFDQAETLEERNKAWERVSATRRFRDARRLDTDSVDYLSHWYYPAVRELAACAEFRADPEWVASVLRPRISVPQARHALDLLLSLGLLRRDDDGRVVQGDASLVTPHEVSGMAASNYHAAMVERAREAIGQYRAEERHYCAVTVSVPLSLVPRLKRELNAFQERILDLCDGDEGSRERVYQVNLQLVPLSEAMPRSVK